MRWQYGFYFLMIETVAAARLDDVCYGAVDLNCHGPVLWLLKYISILVFTTNVHTYAKKRVLQRQMIITFKHWSIDCIPILNLKIH